MGLFGSLNALWCAIWTAVFGPPGQMLKNVGNILSRWKVFPGGTVQKRCWDRRFLQKYSACPAGEYFLPGQCKNAVETDVFSRNIHKGLPLVYKTLVPLENIFWRDGAKTLLL
jgi:hypothetical protein